ncbi:Aste57867_10326 [Aphanomyces stellatus]|uniref:Aste57867_10326 protein n=1 Tax=Aphanomyces stellatus TaxID=120398 RepID=A0A485KQK0_9STRA|nr:hypothetical protein As57867_010286 [Aphanomyces stellatus]VFT87200.1 Aste57867_10326 [Aphanomyces stellatus]
MPSITMPTDEASPKQRAFASLAATPSTPTTTGNGRSTSHPPPLFSLHAIHTSIGGRKGGRFAWFVVGLALVCLASISAAVALAVHKAHTRHGNMVSALQQSAGLKIQLVLKQETMRFAGGVDRAIVYAIPKQVIPSTRLQFDATMVLANSQTNQTSIYTFVDDIGYVATRTNAGDNFVTCIDPSQLPALDLIQTSLAQASELDQVVVAAREGDNPTPLACEGTWLRTSLMGETFFVCKSTTDRLVSMDSQDFRLTFDYVDNVSTFPTMEAPVDVHGNVPTCKRLSSSLVTLAKSWTQHATEAVQALAGAPRQGALSPTNSCGCSMPKKKPCLFVHGLGFPIPLRPTPLDPFYWGFIHRHAPCCSSVKFIHLDTFRMGWDDPALQRQFCDVALDMSGSTDNHTLGEMILVSHSMGNSIVAGAFATNTCVPPSDTTTNDINDDGDSPANKVTWVSLSAAMQGSKGINVMMRQCATNPFLKDPLSMVGVCPPSPAFVSMQHMATAPDGLQAKLLAAIDARVKYATHVMCGTSPTGLMSIYSPILLAMSKWFKPDAIDDGMVDVNSCMAGFDADAFGSSSTDKLFKGPINHADTSFRNGDAWIGGDDRKPIKWFTCAL